MSSFNWQGAKCPDTDRDLHKNGIKKPSSSLATSKKEKKEGPS